MWGMEGVGKIAPERDEDEGCGLKRPSSFCASRLGTFETGIKHESGVY